MTELFDPTCEICGRSFVVTRAEQDRIASSGGTFTCDYCVRAMRPKTKRKHSIDPNRRMGCTVTFRDARGHTWSCHESGKTTEALRSITSRIPEDKGVVVVSVSTWRTILRDLKGPWRRTRGMVDPYAVERALLGKIKRLDLLPPEAAPVFDRVDRRR